jgi:hypothetical protein
MRERNRLRTWSVGRPPLLVAYAIEVASSVDACTDLLKIVFDGAKHPMFVVVPPIQTWLSLYKNHRVVRGIVAETFIGAGVGSIANSGIAWLVRFAGMNPSQQAIERQAIAAEFQAMSVDEKAELLQTVRGLVNDIRNGDGAPSSSEANNAFQKVEIQFFLRVAFPCWLLYGQTATRMYQQARHSNFDALDDLLRLDKALVADRRIASRLMWARWQNRPLFDKLSSAISGRPSRKISTPKLKVVLAGLISRISQHFPQPLTAPDIRGLFDAIAQDNGRLRDLDIPTGDEAWAKAIQRERLFWQSVPAPIRQPDKNNG